MKNYILNFNVYVRLGKVHLLDKQLIKANNYQEARKKARKWFKNEFGISIDNANWKLEKIHKFEEK